MSRCCPRIACLPVSESTAARRRAPRGRGAELRGEILRAAMDLLAKTGDESAVSVRAVAQRVGVSVPSIYLHFADKRALIDAVCAEVFEALHQRLRAAAEGAPDPFSGLRAQGNAYVHFALENPEQYRVIMMQAHEPAEESVDSVVASGAFGYLVESVRACIEEGVLEGEPVELALGLWAAAHGIAALLVAKPYFPWPDVDALIDRTVCMAGLGLAAGTRVDTEQSLPELVERLEALRS
jgi:AcrR family transcriptional regulator